ncbi:hypothetical protein [Roseovarius sp.]|uniref:hypothetical protein n=1 Tax=Roseovarius sp. TaxID=1486281 RepID=UPI003564D569
MIEVIARAGLTRESESVPTDEEALTGEEVVWSTAPTPRWHVLKVMPTSVLQFYPKVS